MKNFLKISIITIICSFLFILTYLKSVEDPNLKKISNLNNEQLNTLIDENIEKIKNKDEYKNISSNEWFQIKSSINNKSGDSKLKSIDWSLISTNEKYLEYKQLNIIDYNNLHKKINSSKEVLVLYSQPRCPHCNSLLDEKFKKFWTEQLKNGKQMYIFNYSLEKEFVKEDGDLWNKKLDNSNENYSNKGVPGTPAFAIYKNGKVIKNILGESSDEMIKWIKKNLE